MGRWGSRDPFWFFLELSGCEIVGGRKPRLSSASLLSLAMIMEVALSLSIFILKNKGKDSIKTSQIITKFGSMFS